MSYILSIDQGTTGTTACLINSKTFQFVDKVNCEFKQFYPRPSLVEHDLNEIWETVKQSVSKLLKQKNISANEIKAIGITNQRETTCAFDSQGTPLANAIVWQDRRTANYCEGLKNKDYQQLIKKTTGLTIDPYFSATKMNWFLNNSKSIQENATNHDLKFGTIDTFLLYKLTGCTSYKTEVTNASRTMLMDLKTRNWSEQMLEIFEISKECLPEICDSFCDFGVTKGLDFLPDGIQITGILGDQQSALFGQVAVKKGQMKCTYGTGAFILLNTGEDIVYSDNGLLTTVAFQHNGIATYALEGSCYIAGAAVQWLRDNLTLFKESHEIEVLARSVSDLKQMQHLMFIPFFTGVASPYWNSEIKATITGITRDTEKSHLSLACLDGIALSINDLINSMQKDLKAKINSINVDGGACCNNLLMEIQATISDLNIIRPKIIETTAYGAALAAAIGAQMITIKDMEKLWQKDKIFSPKNEWKGHYSKKYDNWKNWCKKHC